MSDRMNEAGSSALIGYTGFVGGNLLAQHRFDALFNSSNIEDIAGRNFDLVVCAGTPAEKWKANQFPERDLENIERLTESLMKTEVRHFVLISTVDVFIHPVNVDEDSPTPAEGLHAYGRHRLQLEELVSARFDALVIRLPALYGSGLKRNAVFDLLNRNDVHKIDSRNVLQFYCIDRLWSDIERALDNELPLVHLVTEPVSISDVAREAFDIEFTNEVAATPIQYDVHTNYADLFGGKPPYIETRTSVLAGLGAFVARERARRG
jgi:nucleoside-diphosphate-sugar epimerase